MKYLSVIAPNELIQIEIKRIEQLRAAQVTAESCHLIRFAKNARAVYKFKFVHGILRICT